MEPRFPVATSTTGGKGKGKGPPLPPKELREPPRTTTWSGPKVSVRDGNLKPVAETIVTGIDGIRRIERPNGTVEVIQPTSESGMDQPHNGRMADRSWPLPRLAAECSALARPGYRLGEAHEYLDDEDVLRCKVALLSDMLKKAKHTVVYGGAGLSTASGISDFATHTGSSGVLAMENNNSSKEKTKKAAAPVSPHLAMPNLGHRVVAALSRAGLIWRFIQQNHDGLPQKAGMPQHSVNEIHGGIFDPSNPVVPMSGSLRSDLFQDLLCCERKADLVITLGSSLAGMNSDRLVRTCADRAGSTGLGSVIVSLQTTPHDSDSSVRIYATIDRVMELLAEQLALDIPPLQVPPRPCGMDMDVFDVPYDSEGRLLEDAQNLRTWDLRTGSIHHITQGPNKGARAIVLGKLQDECFSHYRVGIRLRPDFQGDWEEIRILGSWWVDAAIAGDVARLPLMSIDVADVAS